MLLTTLILRDAVLYWQIAAVTLFESSEHMSAVCEAIFVLTKFDEFDYCNGKIGSFKHWLYLDSFVVWIICSHGAAGLYALGGTACIFHSVWDFSATSCVFATNH